MIACLCLNQSLKFPQCIHLKFLHIASKFHCKAAVQESSKTSLGFKREYRIQGMETKSVQKLTLAILVGIFVLLFGIWMIRREQMRRMKGGKLKHKYFSHKEGIELQQKLATHEAYAERRMKIFTFEELQTATNGFDHDTKIGEGVLGSVYRGILPDKTVVAIQKLKLVNSARIVNEVIALSQINHRNVVKLLGCCLRTRKPFLVYEYFPNIGTLYNHTYGGHSSPFPLELRMKIAVEVAAALAYLHSSTSKPLIIHQNLKTMNILLDDKYMVKLTDYGFSPPRGRIKVQRTLGYLDPECLRTRSPLTRKSDVYSFGVVLAELITSRRAVSPHRPEAERSLAHLLAKAMEGEEVEDLHELLDEEILVEDMELVEKVADLASRCIRERGEERPSMKEVAMELEALRIMAKHPAGTISFSESPERTEQLATQPSDAYIVDVGGEDFDGGNIRTNAQEFGYHRLEADYYLT